MLFGHLYNLLQVIGYVRHNRGGGGHGYGLRELYGLVFASNLLRPIGLLPGQLEAAHAMMFCTVTR